MSNDIRLNDKMKYSFKKIGLFLMRTLPVNVFLVSATGDAIWANKKMLKTLGTSLKDFSKLHISHWGIVRWLLCKAVIDKCQEIAIEEKGDDNRHYWTIRKPIVKDNKVQGVLGVSLDITERKKAEIAKTQFLENIAHDIRTPLTGMSGVTQLMQATLMEEMHKTDCSMYADLLAESVGALSNYINHILESVKLSTGERVVNLQKCSLSEILDVVEKLQRPVAIQKNLTFTVEKGVNVPTNIIGDSLRIKSILIELIANSMKYTEHGFVKCLVQMEQKDAASILVFRVEDSGIGIPEDKYQDIFDKFTRLNKAHEGKYTGSGLGLSSVKQLLQDLNAEIHVESTLGVGSAFTCRIPVQLPKN